MNNCIWFAFRSGNLFYCVAISSCESCNNLVGWIALIPTFQLINFSLLVSTVRCRFIKLWRTNQDFYITHLNCVFIWELGFFTVKFRGRSDKDERAQNKHFPIIRSRNNLTSRHFHWRKIFNSSRKLFSVGMCWHVMTWFNSIIFYECSNLNSFIETFILLKFFRTCCGRSMIT